jgi:hypothetical protein
MTYKGHIENGAIVLDEPVTLPNGAEVMVELAALQKAEDGENVPTLAERLACVIGKAECLPADWAENHDVYLRQEYGR